MKDYDKQAAEFLKKTNTTINKVFSHNGKHFANDEQVRDIYIVTIKRGNRQFNFNFGQSIIKSKKFQDKLNKRLFTANGKSAGNHNYKYLYPENFPKTKAEERFGDFNIIEGEVPKEYDILTCLTKYDPGTLEDFCSEFGYDIDSKSAEKTYLAVKEEWKNVQTIWTDKEIELLIEIE